MPSGGKREGAGAKKQAPPEAKRHTLLLTNAERAQVKELIKRMREEKQDENLLQGFHGNDSQH